MHMIDMIRAMYKPLHWDLASKALCLYSLASSCRSKRKLRPRDINNDLIMYSIKYANL